MTKKLYKPNFVQTETEAHLTNTQLTYDDTLTADQLLHELQVHQFELDIQNDELRRVQVALEESRDRYVDLYEFAPVGYLTLTSDGIITELNLTGATLLGVERNKLIKRRFERFVAAEDKDNWNHNFLIVLHSAGKSNFELSLQRHERSIFYAHLDCQLMQGEVAPSVRIALTDITERKRAEDALREMEERNLSSLFDNMHEGYAHCKMLFEHDVPVDFIYLKVNGKFEQLTGLTGVIGKRVSEVIPGIRESNPDIFEIYGRVASTGQTEKFETYVEALGIWLFIAVYSPSKDHFVAVFDNITERKRAEQELMLMNNQLTHEVAKRTSDLTALTAHIQNIAETERANIARELHDELGSTLVGLSMEVGRLRGKIADPGLLQDLSEIKELIFNAVRIKREVVDQLYPTVLDNSGFVGAFEWLVTEYKKHSGIKVELLLPEEDVVMEPTFALAAYRIAQECLTNIAKHADASKVYIEAKVSDGFLDLTIHDNGKGFPEKIVSDGHGIFGMIERARYLGGSMEIGSEDKGTTARLHLPLEFAKPKNIKKVLVVDDHAIVRDAIRQLLGDQADDFSVEGEAANGEAAIQMALEGEWDLVLLDISLPKMNGIRVLEKIKAAKPGLPVIMLSSHVKDDYGDLALLKGAACYVEKGETSKLVEAMRQATLHNSTI